MDLHGWSETAQQLSGFAAKGEWDEMPMLITDEMLSEFCLMTTQENLANDLKKRYDGIAESIDTLHTLRPGAKRMSGGEVWRRHSINFLHIENLMSKRLSLRFYFRLRDFIWGDFYWASLSKFKEKTQQNFLAN